jgi:phage terminase small subunit
LLGAVSVSGWFAPNINHPIQEGYITLMRKLNTKQEAFAKAVVLNGGDKVAAFKKAGWSWVNFSKNSLGVQADKAFKKPNISLRIKQLQEAKEIKAKKVFDVDAEWVLNSLKSVADRCMVAEPVMVKGREGMEPSGEYKFDSSGANRSLELIGRHFKMFTDKVELSSDPENPLTLLISEISGKTLGPKVDE